MSLRWKFFFWHLSASAVLLSVFAALAVWVWYAPWPLFSLQGGVRVLALMVLLDVVLGPSFTALVCSPKKSRRELAVDVSLIVLLQSAAFAYGGWVLYSERPLFMALVDGQVEVVRAPDIHVDAVDSSVAGQAQAWGPQWVWVEVPAMMKFNQLLSQATGSPGMALKPAYYRPLASVQEAVLARQALPEQALRDDGALVGWLKARQLAPDRVWVFPVQGRGGQGSAVFAKEKRALLGLLAE